jgi:hypothetical protein
VVEGVAALLCGGYGYGKRLPCPRLAYELVERSWPDLGVVLLVMEEV